MNALLAAVAATGIAVGPYAMAAPDLPATARIEISLEDVAVSWDGKRKVPFVLDITRSRGILDRVVMGAARALHSSDYPGRLIESSVAPDKLRVVATFEEFPDAWTPTSDWCRFEVEAARDADGGFTGTWKGRFGSREGAGKVTAVLRPLRETPNWTPPAPGEHPRFLFRVSDLPALKAKAETPWGKAEIERLKKLAAGFGGPDTEAGTARAVALGLLYHLTGDKTFADKGREILIADIPNWYNVMYVHGAAACVSQGAIAYDLLYPTADDSWRAKMQSVFRSKMQYLYFPPVGGFNNKDGSNWSAMFRSALGMAALVSLSAPVGEQPELPPNEIVVMPAQSKPAAAGEVVAPLVPDRAIGSWLHAGPFYVASTTEVISAVGGPNARPVAGATATYTTQSGTTHTVTFTPLPKNCLVTSKTAKLYGKPELEGGVDYAATSKRKYLTTHVLSTVLDVREAGALEWDHSTIKLDRLNAWLDGRPIRDADILRLKPGQHHLMMEVAIGACGSHEIIESHARFRPISPEDEAMQMAKAKRRRAHAEAAAKADAADKADSRARDWFAVGQRCAIGWVERALGDNGWNAEGEAYSQHTFRQLFMFAHAMRNATGHDLAAGRALQAVFPCYVARTVFREDSVAIPTYGPGFGALGPDNWARGFGLVEDRFRQICLANWDKTQAMTEEGTLKTFCTAASRDVDACSAAFRFVNHPGIPAKPEDPAALLPKASVDNDKGIFLFRNGWRDADDSVAAVLVEATEPNQSWYGPEGGDLRWFALGCDWVERGIPWGNGVSTRNPDPKTGKMTCTRGMGSVIQVPGFGATVDRPGPAAGIPRGKLISSDLKGDGSGVVAMDLSNWFLGVSDEEYTDRAGAKKTRKVAKDAGVRVLRSVAVDHSGASGAPALMAVADKLTGSPGGETWQLCTMPEHKVTFEGQTFTIASTNGPTLRGTVVAPAGAVITNAFGDFVHEANYFGRHGHVRLKRQVVKVRGPGSLFFVVMTVQRGAAPAVTADAAGTVAKVGGRTLRFADGKLAVE